MPLPRTDIVTVERTGETLRFAGALTRVAVAATWIRAARLLDGVRVFDLTSVPRVDSAGVALLAELAAHANAPLALRGEPAGFDALRAAYRLSPTLAFT